MANEVEVQTEEENSEILEIKTPADSVFDDEVKEVSESEEVVKNSTESEELVETNEDTEEIVDTEITDEETVTVVEFDEDTISSTQNDFEDEIDETSDEDTNVTPEVLIDGVATSTSGASDYTASTTPGLTDEDTNAATSTSIPEDELLVSTSTDDSSINEITNSSEISDNSDSSSIDDEESSIEEENEAGTDNLSGADDEELETVDSEIDNDESADNSLDSDEEENIGDDIIKEGVSNIVSEVVTLTRQLVTEENYYQFSRQSCVPVGDGTFHCTQNTGITMDEDSVVYAEQDEEGDMEIFLKTSKGTVKQITDNNYDDTAPDYDAETMTLVWQRLIDGRYQIISYDIEDELETQLTFSRTNNMDPKVSHEGIVWQAWDGDDWEIIFFDGKFTNIITDNSLQDVTPVIEDGYILWSILGGKEQEARVYSIESGETMTITGHDGGVVTNPRFVLVYDTKFDNGDVVTQGFDPTTGLSAPISAQPADAPVEIPEADPIGEVRALIQNKSSQKDNDVVSVSADNNDAGSLDISNASTSASNLVISDLGNHDISMDQATVTDMTIPEFELSEYDLVITKGATSTSLADISDELPIITERVASSTQE